MPRNFVVDATHEQLVATILKHLDSLDDCSYKYKIKENSCVMNISFMSGFRKLQMRVYVRNKDGSDEDTIMEWNRHYGCSLQCVKFADSCARKVSLALTCDVSLCSDDGLQKMSEHDELAYVDFPFAALHLIQSDNFLEVINSLTQSTGVEQEGFVAAARCLCYQEGLAHVEVVTSRIRTIWEKIVTLLESYMPEDDEVGYACCKLAQHLIKERLLPTPSQVAAMLKRTDECVKLNYPSVLKQTAAHTQKTLQDL